jgi:hypothetical protein
MVCRQNSVAISSPVSHASFLDGIAGKKLPEGSGGSNQLIRNCADAVGLPPTTHRHSVVDNFQQPCKLLGIITG